MSGIIRKLFLSVLSFILILSLFGTVTFAWFSIANMNSIHNISVDISTGNEFEISLDGENFFKEISSQMIMESILNKVELVDVTSIDGINFERGGPNGTIPAYKNVDYITVALWFRTTRAQRTVYLVNNTSNVSTFENPIEGTYVVSRGINWRADVTFQNGENEEDIVQAGDRNAFYATDSLRIGFVEEKVLLNTLDERDDSELIRTIIDLSGDSTRGYGQPYGAFDYYNQKRGNSLTIPLVKPVTIYELTEFDSYNPYKPLNKNSEVLQMIKTSQMNEDENTYYLGKVIMNIWLEGWDADCLNAILRDSIKIKLEFRAGYSYLVV